MSPHPHVTAVSDATLVPLHQQLDRIAQHSVKKVLLPGVTTLTRLISSVRERVAERIWQRLSSVVTPEQCMDLEGLLARAGTSRITNLERLHRAPSRASAPVLVQALARLAEIRGLDVGPQALGQVPAARIKALAQYAVTTKAQASPI